MSEDGTQTAPIAQDPVVLPSEPPQAPATAPSTTIADPTATPSPTEAALSGTADPASPTMPPEAPESPRTLDTSNSTNIPEPEKPLETPVAASAATPSEPIVAPPSAPTILSQNPRSFLTKALEKIQFRKRAKLAKIMQLANAKKVITNDQVEKLLHVSDSTAQRYLSQLSKEGKLRRIGKDGSTKYEPSNGSNGGN